MPSDMPIVADCSCQTRWDSHPSTRKYIGSPGTLEPTYGDPREHGSAEELSLIDLQTIHWAIGPPSEPSRGI